MSADQKEYDWEKIRYQMWQYEQMCTTTLCETCNTCGGSSSSWCECAYKRFQPSKTQMRQYARHDEEQQQAALARKKEALLKRLAEEQQ